MWRNNFAVFFHFCLRMKTKIETLSYLKIISWADVFLLVLWINDLSFLYNELDFSLKSVCPLFLLSWGQLVSFFWDTVLSVAQTTLDLQLSSCISLLCAGIVWWTAMPGSELAPNSDFFYPLSQGMINLVLECIDRLHVYSSAAHFADVAGREAGESWKSILNSLYELLGKDHG